VLLCTLDQVLWPNNGWERVGMDKLQDPSKVKLYYRKATMLCHPDKIGSAEDNPDKVYIANRCFAAITEAYKQFQKEENIQ
jgi:curved DNA-binding protein CbpA